MDRYVRDLASRFFDDSLWYPIPNFCDAFPSRKSSDIRGRSAFCVNAEETILDSYRSLNIRYSLRFLPKLISEIELDEPLSNGANDCFLTNPDAVTPILSWSSGIPVLVDDFVVEFFAFKPLPLVGGLS